MADDPKRELTDLLREVVRDWVMIRRRGRQGGAAPPSPMMLETYSTTPATPAPTLQTEAGNEWENAGTGNVHYYEESLVEDLTDAPSNRARKEPKQPSKGQNPWEYLVDNTHGATWGNLGLPESEAQLRGFDPRPYPPCTIFAYYT